MERGHDAQAGICGENRHAVRRLHTQQQIRSVGHQAIRFKRAAVCGFKTAVVSTQTLNMRPMYLMRDNELHRSLSGQRFSRNSPVAHDQGAIVGGSKT